METLTRGLERKESVSKTRLERENSSELPSVSDIHSKAVSHTLTHTSSDISFVRVLRCIHRG